MQWLLLFKTKIVSEGFLTSFNFSKSVSLQCLQKQNRLLALVEELMNLLAKPSDNCCCSLFSEAATVGTLQKMLFLKSLQIS